MGRSNPIADYRETTQGLQVLTIKKPTLKYINEFLSLKCAPDLILSRVFPNAKEITESMAVYNAVRKYGHKKEFDLDNPTVTLVAVGDGCTPRTAALFAFRTAWECYSVDPRLRPRKYEIDRLWVEPQKVQEVSLGHPEDPIERLVLALPHAHVPFSEFPPIYAKRLLIVAMPCCVPYGEPEGCTLVAQYDDWGCHSPERTVSVWRREEVYIPPVSGGLLLTSGIRAQAECWMHL